MLISNLLHVLFLLGSLSVNVSTTSSTGKTEFVNAGQLSDNSSFRNEAYISLPIGILALFVHIAILRTFRFS